MGTSRNPQGSPSGQVALPHFADEESEPRKIVTSTELSTWETTPLQSEPWSEASGRRSGVERHGYKQTQTNTPECPQRVQRNRVGTLNTWLPDQFSVAI